MSFHGISLGNVSSYIEQFKFNIRVYDGHLEEMEQSIDELVNESTQQKNGFKSKYNECEKSLNKEILLLEQKSYFVTNKQQFQNKIEIDLKKFSSDLKRIDEILSYLNRKVKEIEYNLGNDIKKESRPNTKFQSNPINISFQNLKSRQTKNPFILAVLPPGEILVCNGCNEPILFYSHFLRHMEEFPVGSKNLLLHSYHIKKECFMSRGFQDKYLNSINLFYEDKINRIMMEDLQNIGFKYKNIRTKDDSESDSDSSDTMSQHSGGSQEPLSISQFIYRRKFNTSNEKVLVCSACQKVIISDSFLTFGNNSAKPLHITKKCVQFGERRSLDFSCVKCKVFQLLRNHDELKELLLCGFYYNKIIGFRPQSTGVKAFNRDREAFPESVQTVHYVFRRNESAFKPTIECIGCKKIISQKSYLTRGDTFSEPLHIKKQCIRNSFLGSYDLSRTQCRVFKLLRDYKELQKLLACGFFYNNIIGDRPKNPNVKNEVIKPTEKVAAFPVSPPKMVGFIFNQEDFHCTLLAQGQRCEGCLQSMKKGEMGLRHKERIPREKLKDNPLVSQYYHPIKNCLSQRGFTDKYLEFVICHVTLSVSDSQLKVMDILVRCGFSSENLKFSSVEENLKKDTFLEKDQKTLGFVKQSNKAPYSPPHKNPLKDPVKQYLFIVNCTKESAHCEGCGFNLAVNRPCFSYTNNSVQNNISKCFHISEDCLKNHFTKTEILSLTCINNNSIADVSSEDIIKCGITKIEKRLPPQFNKSPLKAEKCNPLKLNYIKFSVDIVMDNRVLCSACQEPLQLDKYVLKTLSNTDSARPISMHLDAACVRKCGYFPQQLAQSELNLEVYVSPAGLRRLEECGFRNIPQA